GRRLVEGGRAGRRRQQRGLLKRDRDVEQKRGEHRTMLGTKVSMNEILCHHHDDEVVSCAWISRSATCSSSPRSPTSAASRARAIGCISRSRRSATSCATSKRGSGRRCFCASANASC